MASASTQRKVLPDQELSKSTNIDYEKDSYSEIRDDTHTSRASRRRSRRESDECEDKSDDDRGGEQHSNQDEEGGPKCFMGKNSERG